MIECWIAATVFTSVNNFLKFASPTNSIFGLYTDQFVRLYPKLMIAGTINKTMNPMNAGRIIRKYVRFFLLSIVISFFLTFSYKKGCIVIQHPFSSFFCLSDYSNVSNRSLLIWSASFNASSTVFVPANTS